MDVFSGLSCLREVRCLASIPFPLTPTLSPRRGSHALRTQVETASTWQGLAIVLPLLGERVGVRGTGAHDYPRLTHRNHRGTIFSSSEKVGEGRTRTRRQKHPTYALCLS